LGDRNVNKPVPLIPKDNLLEQVEKETDEEPASAGTTAKRPLKRKK